MANEETIKPGKDDSDDKNEAPPENSTGGVQSTDKHVEYVKESVVAATNYVAGADEPLA